MKLASTEISSSNGLSIAMQCSQNALKGRLSKLKVLIVTNVQFVLLSKFTLLIHVYYSYRENKYQHTLYAIHVCLLGRRWHHSLMASQWRTMSASFTILCGTLQDHSFISQCTQNW